MQREDNFTSTVDGAHGFEMMRGGGYGKPEGQPSLNEVAGDEYLDRAAAQRQQEADRIARERGDYVPTMAMRLSAITVGTYLAQHLVPRSDIRAVREGVLAITLVDPDVVMAALSPEHYEVRVGDGIVWVRILSMYSDPFLVSAAADDEAPF